MKNLFSTLKIINALGRYKGKYLFAIVISALSNAGVSILIGFIFKNVIDGISNLDYSLYYRSLIYLAILIILLCIINPIVKYIYNVALESALAELRVSIYNSLKKCKVKYLEQSHSADIISRATNDIDALRKAFKREFLSLVGVVISGIGAIIVMFTQNITIAIGFITFGVISGYFVSKFAKPIHEKSKEIQQSKAKMTEYMLETLSGMKTTKIFNLEEEMKLSLESKNKEITSLTIKRGKFFALLYSANTALRWINRTGVLIIGGYLAIRGIIAPGTLVLFAKLQTQASYMFVAFGKFISKLQSSYVSYQRIEEILVLEQEKIVSKNDFVKDIIITNEIVFNKVSFSYINNTKVLDNLSFSIEKNKFYALTGESGAGKSTIIKLLLGLYNIDKGNIFIRGKELHEYSLKELRDLVTYVPQDAYLFDGTIKTNLLYAKEDAKDDELNRVLKDANALEFVNEFEDGINHNVGEGGKKLSGGQRQRIAIARAMLKKAPIILLDEATSALDSITEDSVNKAIKKLMENKTSIVVAHRKSTIKNADKVIVI